MGSPSLSSVHTRLAKRKINTRRIVPMERRKLLTGLEYADCLKSRKSSGTRRRGERPQYELTRPTKGRTSARDAEKCVQCLTVKALRVLWPGEARKRERICSDAK